MPESNFCGVIRKTDVIENRENLLLIVKFRHIHNNEACLCRLEFSGE